MTAIPRDILQQTVDQAPIGGVTRKIARLQADQGSYNYGQKIIFNFPSELIDLRRSYMTFFAQLTLNAGSYCSFAYPLNTLFSRIRVTIGSQVVFDCDGQDVLSGIFKLASSSASVANYTGDGTYTQATRRTESTTGRLYEIKFNHEFLERVIPVDRIQGGYRLELFVNQAVNCLEYDGGIPTLTLNNVAYQYYVLEVSSEVSQTIDAMIASGQYVIKGWAWSTFTGQTQAGTTATLQLPFKFKCIRGMLACYRDQADVTDPLQLQRFVDQFQEDGITLANLKIGSNVVPLDSYQMQFALGYLLPQRDWVSFLNHWYQIHDRQMDFYGAGNAANHFQLAFDTRKDSTSDAWDNGIDTSSNSVNQVINAQFTASPGALAWNVYCCYQVTLQLSARGNVVVDF